jgi:hypothetical protein
VRGLRLDLSNRYGLATEAPSTSSPEDSSSRHDHEMEATPVDPKIGWLVITPQVISTHGQRVAITLVPTRDEVIWHDPGWIDQWSDDHWQQVGGFVTSPHTEHHLGEQRHHGAGVYFGDDPFRDWIWTADAPTTTVESPATVQVELKLPVGHFRLRYGPLAGTLDVVEDNT